MHAYHTQMHPHRSSQTDAHTCMQIHIYMYMHAHTAPPQESICQSLTFSSTTVLCNLLSCLMCVVTYLLTGIWICQWASGDG